MSIEYTPLVRGWRLSLQGLLYEMIMKYIKLACIVNIVMTTPYANCQVFMLLLHLLTLKTVQRSPLRLQMDSLSREHCCL
jgi:hypothetical protein